MSVNAFAKDRGNSQSALSDMLNGKRDWSKSAILIVADFFGLNRGSFFDESSYQDRWLGLSRGCERAIDPAGRAAVTGNLLRSSASRSTAAPWSVVHAAALRGEGNAY